MLVPSILYLKLILMPSILFLLIMIPLAVQDIYAATPQLSFGSLGPGQGQFDTPRGMAVDDSGNIYVADNRNHRVEKFDPSGKYLTEFDKGGIPEGIAVYNGTVYVVDRNSTNVKEFTPDGRLLYSFGSQGTNTGQLSNPERIAIDSSGNIYVADTGDIQKFNSKGVSMSQFFADGKYQCCLNVMGIAVDISGNVYTADMGFHKIIKFSPTGSTLAEFNATFSAPDISGTPQDVAVDKAGNIYVADTYDGRIVKLDSTGKPLSAVAISGVPVGLAIKDDQIYVVDIANSRIDMFLTSQFVNNYTDVTQTSEQKKETQLNQNSSAIDTAIKFAESSLQFQSMVDGYNYTFSSDFEESGPLSKGGIGMTAHGFAFEIYSGPVKPGKAVKVVEVLEDPTLTKILNVTSYPAVYMGPVMSVPENATANNIEIQNIRVMPATIKVGNNFTVIATLINNSSNTIFVEHGACDAPFSVIFDNHVTVKENNVVCTAEMILQKIEPGAKITAKGPYVDLVYNATEPGSTNATITFRYSMWNQTSQANVGKTISKSFQFMILNNSAVQAIHVFTDKDHYDAGDTILVSGVTEPEKYVQIMLIDPNLIIQYKDGTYSDSVGNFFYSLSLPQFVKSGEWKIRATSEQGHVILPVPVGGKVSVDPTELPSYTYKPGMPLEQLESGVAAKDILCRPGFGLVIQTPEDIPSCVKNSTAQALIARGLAITVPYNATMAGTATIFSSFKLFFSEDTNVVAPGKSIGIDIALNNTAPIPLKIMPQNSWTEQDLSLGEQCYRAPMGIAILHGFYTKQNVTQGSVLPIFAQYAVSCPALGGGYQTPSLVFEPLSSQAFDSTCNDGNEVCGGLLDESRHLEVNGTWNNGKFQFFDPGVYTLVGGDEWGHIAIQYFTVTNPSSSPTHVNALNQTLANRSLDNLVSTFRMIGGVGSDSFSPAGRSPEYFNETELYTMNVGKVIQNYPVLVKISDPYQMSPRTDIIPASNILPNGTFHYKINVIGKFGTDQYTIIFIYGNQSLKFTLPVIPP